MCCETVAPETDILAEAVRLLRAAEESSVPLRLIGGLAIRMHIPAGVAPAFPREYQDIDLVTAGGRSRDVGDLLTGLGYQADRQFNALNGRTRLLFLDVRNRRQVDVFVGTFEMCHIVPVADRLEVSALGIPLAELLLTKMQIVELNPKDMTDVLTMLYHHDVADTDAGAAINAQRVAELCAADWGLWRTTKVNTERVRRAIPQAGLEPAAQRLMLDRLDRLWQRIDAVPKPRAWRIRDRIGDRKRWYRQPDEVA
jgi:hypothetical protein